MMLPTTTATFVASPFTPSTRRPLSSRSISPGISTQRQRPVRRHFSPITIYAKKKSPPPQKPKKNPSNNSDPFSSLAAGPSARSSPRLARRTSPKFDTPKDAETTTEAEGNEKPAEVSKETSVESKKAVRALGSQQAVEEKINTNKTAADFIAEGVVDDVDDAQQLSVMDDIRFGIDDISDPFLKGDRDGNGTGRSSSAVAPSSSSSETGKETEEGGGESEVIGKLVNVTGDGGVKKKVLVEGSGSVISTSAKVTVEYTGKLDDGVVFDSSRNRDDSFSFQLGLGTVIKGWESAVATMRVGETSEFVISPQYAYGKRGMQPVIPGNATLTFEIELLEASAEEVEDVQRVSDFNTSIPRTPSEIAESYAKKMDAPDDKKNKSFFERFYFISPFMSQTGERPPWWINPNITFVLIGIFTAIGFYLVVKSGAIHIGYVDEPIDVNIFK